MKLEQAKDYLLLEQSGELSAWNRRRLHRFLARSPEARAFKAELGQCTRLAHEYRDDTPLPEWSLRRILGQGERAQRRPAPLIRQPAWRLAPALAGLLLLLAGAWLLFTPAPEMIQIAQQPPLPAEDALPAWDDAVDTELEQLGALLAGGAEETETLEPEQYCEDVDCLAEELLRLEVTEI